MISDKFDMFKKEIDNHLKNNISLLESKLIKLKSMPDIISLISDWHLHVDCEQQSFVDPIFHAYKISAMVDLAVDMVSTVID